MNAAHIPDIASEVKIPDNGTLSRVVFHNEAMRVVAFAFDAGQELTEHSAGKPAVVQVISGRIELDTGSGAVSHIPGSWTLIPAGLPHSVAAVEPSVMLLTLLS